MAESLLKLSLHVATPRDLLVRYYPNGKLGGLTLDGPLPGPLGQRCELVIHAAVPVQRHFNLRGQLAWVRHKSSRDLKECFGVDFVPEDAAIQRRLLSYANGEAQASESRFGDRVYTELPVRITYDGKVRKEALFDLSLGGAFVRTALPPVVGTCLDFDVRPPFSWRHLRLKGKVAWVRLTGNGRGMGVQFVFGDPAEIEQLRKLLRRMARR